MALDYDFYIDTLGFNTAVSKERPYERATAQFRKDQLDSTATVGDQSLTGWWTRGQLSFHKGAGVKYYEVLGNSDDTIESRFHASAGVDPWRPGEADLSRSLDAITAWTYPILSAASHPSFGDFVAVCDDHIIRKVTGTTVAAVTTSATTYYSLCATNSGVWAKRDASLDLLGTATSWTVPAGANWLAVFALKDRLFAIDDRQRWYQLSSTTGGAVVAGDTFWQASPPSSYAEWVATESPSSVYAGRGDTIYKLGLGTDGLVPAVTYAGVAAQLPAGEVLGDIQYYLGKVVIATNRGVRVGVVQSDDSLIYGPLVIEGNAYGSQGIGAYGSLASPVMVPTGETNPSVFELNLAENITDLVPPYAQRQAVGTGAVRFFGSLVNINGELFAFNNGSLYKQGNALSAIGTLTTGFHRLGTLEPKAFRYLRVKTEGTEGAVDVSVNTPDGATYAVGTVAAGATTEFDLSTITGFPAALEYLSITFTLNRGTTTGPTLLGYQLKALPVPKRQRMIRVPLLLHDSESNRTGQIMKQDPWARLAALEDLEESNAVVSFKDKVTGETGSAYIESVEVQRIASKQFGGFIWVTLRRL